jgi:hypothetical protein
MDAGYGGASKIERNAIRFAVVQGGTQPVPRRDGGLVQQPIYITIAATRVRVGDTFTT